VGAGGVPLLTAVAADGAVCSGSFVDYDAARGGALPPGVAAYASLVRTTAPTLAFTGTPCRAPPCCVLRKKHPAQRALRGANLCSFSADLTVEITGTYCERPARGNALEIPPPSAARKRARGCHAGGRSPYYVPGIPQAQLGLP
jgi:hypothetical protein